MLEMKIVIVRLAAMLGLLETGFVTRNVKILKTVSMTLMIVELVAPAVRER